MRWNSADGEVREYGSAENHMLMTKSSIVIKNQKSGRGVRHRIEVMLVASELPWLTLANFYQVRRVAYRIGRLMQEPGFEVQGSDNKLQ